MLQLLQNTEGLDLLIAMVNALPDAGGSGPVETCTLQRVILGAPSYIVYSTINENGEVTVVAHGPANTLFNVPIVCGSIITIISDYSYALDNLMISSGLSMLAQTTYGCVLKVISPSGESVTITANMTG